MNTDNSNLSSGQRAPGDLTAPLNEQAGYLWTPWRMKYVSGEESPEAECIFCDRLAADDDVRSLIVHRGERVFAIMNLYPYNTGHLMLVPNDHIASPELSDSSVLHDLADLMQRTLAVLRRALKCRGFNIGLNIGSIAGAGVAEHMHQHIVPRWSGDANFMPILAATMVMPELLQTTYAKVRAEFARDAVRGTGCKVVVFDGDCNQLLITTQDGSPRLPAVPIDDANAVWQCATSWLSRSADAPHLAGWAGGSRADNDQQAGLVFTAEEFSNVAPPMRIVEIGDGLEVLVNAGEAEMVNRSLTILGDDH